MTPASCHHTHSSELFISEQGEAGCDRWMLQGVTVWQEKSRILSEGEWGMGVRAIPRVNSSAWGWQLECFVQFGICQSGEGFPGRCLHTSVHSWMTAANLRAGESCLGGEIWDFSPGNDPAQPVCDCTWHVGLQHKKAQHPWR